MIPDPFAYFGGTDIYWHAIFFAAAILGGMLLAWVLRVAQGFWRWRHDYAMWIVTPIALVLGTLLARALYCCFMPEMLEEGFGKFFDLSGGGFMLYGAILGVAAAVFLTRLITKRVYISELFDAIAPAGAAAICAGRCASLFSGEDLGEIVTSPKWQFFPFAVCDGDTGSWYLAVFAFEALAAAIAFIACLVIFILVYVRRGVPTARGSVLVTFLLVFASSQTMLESMRKDSVFFVSLGFVRVNQVVSAIVLFACFVYLNVKAIKKFGFKLWQPILWAVVLGAYVWAFFKEFRLTSGTLVPSYTIMGLCLITICVISFVLLCMTLRPRVSAAIAEVAVPEEAAEPETAAEPEASVPALEVQPDIPAAPAEEAEAAPEAEAEILPEAEAAPEAEVLPETEAAPETEVLPEAEVATEATPEAVTNTPTTPETEAAPAHEAEAEILPETEAVPEAEIMPEAEAATEATPEAVTDIPTTPEAEAVSEVLPESESEPVTEQTGE